MSDFEPNKWPKLKVYFILLWGHDISVAPQEINEARTAIGPNAGIQMQLLRDGNRCIPVNQLDTRKKAFEAALKLAMFE